MKNSIKEKIKNTIFKILGAKKDVFPSGISKEMFKKQVLKKDLNSEQADLIAQEQISKKDTEKREEYDNRINELEKKIEESTNEKEKIKYREEKDRIEIIKSLELPGKFEITDKVDLSNDVVIEYLKKCKEDYLKIPPRFRGEESPKVTFCNEMHDHPYMNEDADGNLGAYAPWNEIIIETKLEYISSSQYEIRGSTISIIAHEMGHYAEKILLPSIRNDWDNIIFKNLWKRLERAGHIRASENYHEALAEAFMEYTTGGLRQERIRLNFLRGLNNGKLDIMKIITKAIENGEFHYSFLQTLHEIHLAFDGILFNIEKSNGMIERLDFNELVELYYMDDLDKNVKISIAENDFFSRKYEIINYIKEFLDLERNIVNRPNILHEFLEAFEKYGNNEEKYFIKGLGMLNDFPLILNFLKANFGRVNYLKSDLLKYFKSY